MSEGEVHLRREGAVAEIVFDRPRARNAMTWSMYERLEAIAGEIGRDPSVRAAVLRGAGGEAFVAGTDIAQFAAFETGEDGIAYERRIAAILGAVDGLRVPTLAVVEGWCVGGGLAIAAVCDLRIATPSARFGVPIARTLGNCLSVANHARLAAEFGLARMKRMLLLAEMLSAEEAREAGFVAEIVAAEAIGARAAEIAERLAGHAPLTMGATKEAARRILKALEAEGDDIVRAVYGSADCKAGVAAFVAKRAPRWTGR